MSGKIPKISLPSSANAEQRRLVENFKTRMYSAVKNLNQARLDIIHNEVEVFIRGVAGASLGPRVIIPVAQPAPPPVEMLDLLGPAVPLVPVAPVEPVLPQEEIRAAIKHAEQRLAAATAILSLDVVPDAVRAWAIQQVTRVN